MKLRYPALIFAFAAILLFASAAQTLSASQGVTPAPNPVGKSTQRSARESKPHPVSKKFVRELKKVYAATATNFEGLKSTPVAGDAATSPDHAGNGNVQQQKFKAAVSLPGAKECILTVVQSGEHPLPPEYSCSFDFTFDLVAMQNTISAVLGPGSTVSAQTLNGSETLACTKQTENQMITVRYSIGSSGGAPTRQSYLWVLLYPVARPARQSPRP